MWTGFLSPICPTIPHMGLLLVLGLLVLLFPAAPAFARLLPAAGHRERARRDVLGDHRARRHVGAFPDGEWRDQARVGPHEAPVADHRLVLGPPVVVAGDGARPDVHATAHLG